jgi:phage tail tape-measure protein
MAIVQKIPTVSKRVSPLGAGMTIAVILLCVASAAAVATWLPGHARGSAGDELPQVSSAPEASPLAVPIAAPVAAPDAAPAPDHRMQPRVRRAAQTTSST